MKDLISREAAVDAVERTDWYHQNQKGVMVHGANSKEHQAWYKAEDVYRALEGVPSAEVRTQMSSADCISRQAAIDAVSRGCQEFRGIFARCEKNLNELPSAQPEIIRCKDCKHYVIHTLFGHRQGWCERLCDEYDKSLAKGTEEDDFCSRAERRTDE